MNKIDQFRGIEPAKTDEAKKLIQAGIHRYSRDYPLVMLSRPGREKSEHNPAL